MNAVAVYRDNDFGRELAGFEIMSIKVRKSARVTSAPLESGETSADYKVLNPIHITVDGYIDCAGNTDFAGAITLDCLNEMFLMREHEFYSVITKDAKYNNLVLQECPHDEDAEKPYMAHFRLEFVEAMVVQGKSTKTSSGDNSDTTQRGYVGFVSAAATGSQRFGG